MNANRDPNFRAYKHGVWLHDRAFWSPLVPALNMGEHQGRVIKVAPREIIIQWDTGTKKIYYWTWKKRQGQRQKTWAETSGAQKGLFPVRLRFEHDPVIRFTLGVDK